MNLRGLLFDIRRFSTHDGGGIRTTIFFKGCPLRCDWCQNPEGIAPEAQLVHFAHVCILCGSCLSGPNGAVEIMDGCFCLHKEKVRQPLLYEELCPSGALRLDSKWYTVAETIEIALRDRIFFRQGGGVTLSGGEPFFQPAFMMELLKMLKMENIHTAVETSLWAEQSVITAALPYIDVLFADLKIFDGKAHCQMTGRDNACILSNIALVLKSAFRDRVIIRTPLIPQYTAVYENITAICRYIVGLYPEVRYEILNYNPLAKAKYDHVERDYCFVENPPLYTKVQMEEFYHIARAAGIKNLIVEE